jgi:hypothetical protein
MKSFIQDIWLPGRKSVLRPIKDEKKKKNLNHTFMTSGIGQENEEPREVCKNKVSNIWMSPLGLKMSSTNWD